MTISYPLQFPSGIGVNSVSIRAANAVGGTRSIYNYKTKVQDFGGQQWRATITVPTIQRDFAEEWNTFLLKLNGSFGTFLLGDPNGTTPRGSVAGTPLVNGAAQTGNILNVDGFTPDQTNVLRAGDYIQLGTFADARLYKVLDDVDSDGSGEAALTLWPNMRESPADNSPVITSSPQGVFRLINNTNGWDINSESQYFITFEAQEVI